jgi:hypothetical protein
MNQGGRRSRAPTSTVILTISQQLPLCRSFPRKSLYPLYQLLEGGAGGWKFVGLFKLQFLSDIKSVGSG